MIKDNAPSFMNNIREIAALWSAIEPELEELRSCISKLPFIKLPGQTDKDLISRLEQFYDIPSLASLSVEERAATLNAAVFAKPPFTENKLRQILTIFTGREDGYTLEVDSSARTVRITLAVSTSRMSIATAMIRQIIPANMLLSVTPKQ